ncbi:UDP-N-acetylmuramoyl-tripeptide--D-alanyl-D-alanine ligase [Murinocardiopsis flavida]|uniref:UDP-N-acetylmuramoyl-tripeptide--D-alanyl-D-alanine ligase n=1 Tax=Murinocardiopsis flavida TaxID=645275 RepID=A0A2P8D3K4_9ACTN|nr:UDP-N-acetylmuramoyl-tripeptide--D-alanyl-D-alanine ligase [Murinocardiopsis flavida]PSK91798.1 UDP-N-acetylmuramoyl-tripeptide--D-alanyl-D-alanine ligase [Murinocardiopsis flavida]
MIALSLDRIAEITESRLSGPARPADTVTGPVVVDSRQELSGGLFVALNGERADGHDFAAAAVEAGAVAVLGSRPVDGVPVLVVDGGDPAVLDALGRLAAHVLGELPSADVIGVTGSAGKTTTKDLLAQALRRLGPTIAPPGSFNNEIGHPLTVLRADPATRFLALEVSARGIGHIAHLCRIAPPRIGVVLNVGSAHLGEFGSKEAIATAKGELVEALPPAGEGGVAVLNADDPAVRAMAARTAARVVTFSDGSEDADVYAREVDLDATGRVRFRLHVGGASARVRLALVGGHQLHNALAVAAVAAELGMGIDDIADLLGSAGAVSRWRMEVGERADGVTVVNDAYNANPESMAAALRTLVAMAAGRRRVAVLGEMAELGEGHQEAHEAVGRLVAESGTELLVVVGAEAGPIGDGARNSPHWTAEREIVAVPDAAHAAEALRDRLLPGDVVIVKGSRVVALEQVAEQLMAVEAVR